MIKFLEWLRDAINSIIESLKSSPNQPKLPSPPKGEVVVPKVPMGMEEDDILAGLDVAFDCGHGSYPGGWEPGAVSRQGWREYDQILRYVSKTAKILESKGARVSVFSYAKGTKGLSLASKGAKSRGHDCFISCHLNAFHKPAQGTEVLVHTKATSEDKLLANKLNYHLNKELGLANRGVKLQGLGVLRGVPLSVPAACLIEPFFLTDVGNEGTLDGYIDATAKGLAAGIEDYWSQKQGRK